MGIERAGVGDDEEALRVAALRATGVLDGSRGGSFTPLVELAARLLDAPMACVSLIDSDRQLFKASVGLDRVDVPREWGVWSDTLAAGGTMAIEDAAADPRFAGHPAIVGLGARSYLGTILRLPGGEVAGTLCVIDRKPRRFGPGDVATIEGLGRMADELLRAQAQSIALAEQAEQTRLNHEASERATRYLEQAEHIGRIGHWSMDGDGRLLYSKQTHALYGLPTDATITSEIALDFYVPGDRKRVRRIIADAIERLGEFDYEASIITRSGDELRVRAIGKVTLDDQGRPCLFGVVQDISDESARRDQLRWAATHDSLTGLLNRRAFHEEGALLAAAGSDSLFCALIDLDHLKLVNDIFGHAAGDHALCVAAERMMESFPDAMVARLGGDEFGILVEGDEEAIRGRLAALVEQLHQPRDSAFGTLTLGATIGLSRVRGDRSLEAAEQRADAALYHGKQSERGSVVRNRLAIERRATARLEQTARVRKGLHDGAIRTFFQPIVELREGSVVGAEALIRLCRDGEVVAAEQFYLGLGDSRVAGRVFDRVLTDSIALLASCERLGSVSVNIAPSDLMSARFADDLLARLGAAGVSPARLVVEITESTLLLGEQGRVRAVLERLREAGVGIALDDFGTGYSSLSHVSDFPITRLKIDKRFVRRMTSHPKERAVTLAIINLARQLGLELVAEGIEDEASRIVLVGAGCQMGQGFYWSPAIDDLPAYLDRHASRDAPPRAGFAPRAVG